MSDNPWWEVLVYDAIDVAQQRALRETTRTQSSLESRVHELEEENLELRQAVVRTHAIVTVLGRHLVEARVLDGDVIANALREALAPKPAAPPVWKSPPPPQQIACFDCKETVDVAGTQMSEQGPICEGCYRNRELAALARQEK